ncbi:hypothetical protein B0H13DRAFT_2581055 [Mycena leptocephala]|nr:hypothetical protein B0H13DRAFT_2581055 [Mycena leptocephala]
MCNPAPAPWNAAAATILWLVSADSDSNPYPLPAGILNSPGTLDLILKLKRTCRISKLHYDQDERRLRLILTGSLHPHVINPSYLIPDRASTQPVEAMDSQSISEPPGTLCAYPRSISFHFKVTVAVTVPVRELNQTQQCSEVGAGINLILPNPNHTRSRGTYFPNPLDVTFPFTWSSSTLLYKVIPRDSQQRATQNRMYPIRPDGTVDITVANYSTSRKHDGVRAKSTRSHPERARRQGCARRGKAMRWECPPQFDREGALHAAADTRMYTCADGSVSMVRWKRRIRCAGRDFGRQGRNEGETQRESAGAGERNSGEQRCVTRMCGCRVHEGMMRLRTPSIGWKRPARGVRYVY